MSRALRLLLEPLHNARLVELAEAVEAGQAVPDLILNQADRAFGHAAIFCEAVLLGRREWQHAGGCRRRAWRGRGLAEVHVLGLTVDRRGAVAGDALADVRFAGVLGMLIAERREPSGTDGAKVFFRDLRDSGRGEGGRRQVCDGGGTGRTASVTEAGHGARDRSAGRLAEALQDRGAIVGAHGSSLLARGSVLSLYSSDIRLVYQMHQVVRHKDDENLPPAEKIGNPWRRWVRRSTSGWIDGRELEETRNPEDWGSGQGRRGCRGGLFHHLREQG